MGSPLAVDAPESSRRPRIKKVGCKPHSPAVGAGGVGHKFLGGVEMEVLLTLAAAGTLALGLSLLGGGAVVMLSVASAWLRRLLR